MSAGPPARTLILGLLGDLLGAGVTFCTPAAFVAAAWKHPDVDGARRAGKRTPHVITILVDAPPQVALPFGRSAAAFGVPATFLLRVGRNGAARRRIEREAFTELTSLRHGLGLTVPASMPAAELATMADRRAASADRLDALVLEGATDPERAHALLASSGMAVCLGPTAIAGAHAVDVAFGLRIDAERLHARSTLGFTLLDRPLAQLTDSDLDCLKDSLTRAPCLVELRLSSLI